MSSSTKANIISKTLLGLGVSAMLISSFSVNASVTYYKSVGANGEVRYSQFPPRDDGKFETITMRSDGRQDDSGELYSSENGGAPKELSASDQQVKMLEERIKKQEEEGRIRQCQSLRNNLTNLNIGGKIYEMKDGQKKYLNEEEINFKREEIKKAITQNCSNKTA